MSDVESAVNWAVSIANDPDHGYSQINRWGPDYDCSSLVITAFDKAGWPVKASGASYTGNMISAFLLCGFTVLTYSSTLPLQRGDILLNVQHHTAIYLGDGKIVEASIDESGGVCGAQSGDQTCREIHIRNFYNFPWQHVIRAPASDKTAPVDDCCSYTAGNACQVFAPELEHGSYGPAVAAAQAALNYHGFGPLTVNGSFDNAVRLSIQDFQKVHKLTVDGIIGPQTWRTLLYWR